MTLTLHLLVNLFSEIQQCGRGGVPRRHVHPGLAGLPGQPGRLHSAPHRGVPARREAAHSIRWVTSAYWSSSIPPPVHQSTVNRLDTSVTWQLQALISEIMQHTSNILECLVYLHRTKPQLHNTAPFLICDEMKVWLISSLQDCVLSPVYFDLYCVTANGF